MPDSPDAPDGTHGEPLNIQQLKQEDPHFDENAFCGQVMTYEWALIRSIGVKTSGGKEFSCLSRGAPLRVNQSGRCGYCGSMFVSGEYDWVISAIRGIQQQTTKTY